MSATDKQFNNQACEIVRAAGYLQDAGYFCAVTYATKGVDLENLVEHPAAIITVLVYNSQADYLAENGEPVLAAIVTQDGPESAATIARQMEALIP